MTPETYIINVISNVWVEKFPQGDTTVFPKGLVKRVSMIPIANKDDIVTGQYRTRISFLWFDKNTIGFDTKMVTTISSFKGLTSNNKILNVEYVERDDGYDVKTDSHVMNLDFIIKHTL